MSHSGHRSSRTDKIVFISKHKELWEVDAVVVKRALVKAGLVSPSTYVLDLGIRELVEKAVLLACPYITVSKEKA